MLGALSRRSRPMPTDRTLEAEDSVKGSAATGRTRRCGSDGEDVPGVLVDEPLIHEPLRYRRREEGDRLPAAFLFPDPPLSIISVRVTPRHIVERNITVAGFECSHVFVDLLALDASVEKPTREDNPVRCRGCASRDRLILR